MANGQTSPVAGKGKVYVSGLKREFNNALYVPNLETNILSISMLTKEGYTVTFENNMCIIKRENDVCAKVRKENNLYVLSDKKKVNVVRNVSGHDKYAHLLHKRRGDASFKEIQKRESFAKGAEVKTCKNYLDCHVCKLAKSKISPIPKERTTKTKRAFELVHADVIGPLPPSTGGSRMF